MTIFHEKGRMTQRLGTKTKRQRKKSQMVTPREQDGVLINKWATNAQMDFRTTLNQRLLCASVFSTLEQECLADIPYPPHPCMLGLFERRAEESLSL